jgi:hypothetical protein
VRCYAAAQQGECRAALQVALLRSNLLQAGLKAVVKVVGSVVTANPPGLIEVSGGHTVDGREGGWVTGNPTSRVVLSVLLHSWGSVCFTIKTLIPKQMVQLDVLALMYQRCNFCQCSGVGFFV